MKSYVYPQYWEGLHIFELVEIVKNVKNGWSKELKKVNNIGHQLKQSGRNKVFVLKIS